jgi:putative phage-type endonuclease
MLTSEQLEARRKGIGGSDIACILGLSPWKTPTELFYEKRGEIDEPDLSDSQVIHFGNVLEGVVADEYARRNDCKVERRNKLIASKRIPYMLANIDRKVVGEQKGLECKTADKFTVKNWGEPGTDQIPDYYRTQCEHYMIVTRYPVWDLAVLVGGNEYRDYHIEQDKELSEVIIEECAKFWERVQQNLVPDFDWGHRTTAGLIKRLYPGTNGETVTLPDNIDHWHTVKAEAEELVKTYQAVVDGAKNRILSAMGENAVGQLPNVGTEYTRSEVKGSTYTVEREPYIVMRNRKMKTSK